MKLLGTGLHRDKLEVGTRWKTCGPTITETDIINLVTGVGMLEPLFLDAEYRKSYSAMQGHAAPAPLTLSLAEGLVWNAMGQLTGLTFLNRGMNVERPRSWLATPSMSRSRRARPPNPTLRAIAPGFFAPQMRTQCEQ